jgi:hypothetical protein
MSAPIHIRPPDFLVLSSMAIGMPIGSIIGNSNISGSMARKPPHRSKINCFQQQHKRPTRFGRTQSFSASFLSPVDILRNPLCIVAARGLFPIPEIGR